MRGNRADACRPSGLSMDAGHLSAGPDSVDARKKLLTLTPEGVRAREADRRERVALVARALTDALGEDERRSLGRALDLIDRVSATIGG